MKCDKKAMLLYAVTDRAWVGKQSLYEQVESALKGGVTCVQLREKELDEEAFLKEAVEISALCKQYGVPFFINDNVEIAVKCCADGIHVGQEDMKASQVRQRVGENMMSIPLFNYILRMSIWRPRDVISNCSQIMTLMIEVR